MNQTKRKCSLFTCISNRKTVNNKLILFPLPTNAIMLEEWMAAFRANKVKFVPSLAGCFICHLHFDSEQIDSKMGINGRMLYALRSGSIPQHFDFKPEIVEMVDVIEVSDDESDTEAKKEHTEEILVEPDVNTSEDSKAWHADNIPCTKCIQTDAEVQKLRQELVDMKNRLRTKDFQIVQLQKKYTVDPKMEKCSICMVKVNFEEILKHLCDKNVQTVKCEHCDLAFPATVLLLDHLEVFHGDRYDYECSKCNGQKFAMINLYEIHKNIHWNEVPQYRCEMCNAAYYQQSELDEHIDAEHNAPEEDPFEKPYKCGSCNTSFECPKSLANHIVETHRRQRMDFAEEFEFPFQCYICKIEWKTYLELRTHFRGHRRKNYTCLVCRSTLNEYDWPVHLCQSMDETLGCEYCSEKFKSIQAITEHLTGQHPDHKMYKCLTCIRCFPMQSMLTHHQELQADQMKSNKCHLCRRQFVTAKGLENHIDTHNASKKIHLCSECGKLFSSDWNLRVHQKQHSRTRQFKCDDCPASFHFQNALVMHSEIHQNKKYVCTVCAVELRTLRSLYTHLKRHKRNESQDFKWVCSECGRKFHARHILMHHLSHVHSTIRQFQCDFLNCSRSYKHKGDLNKHLRTHLGEDMYACPEKGCSKRYRTPFELQQHSYDHYKQGKATTTSTVSMETSSSA